MAKKSKNQEVETPVVETPKPEADKSTDSKIEIGGGARVTPEQHLSIKLSTTGRMLIQKDIELKLSQIGMLDREKTIANLQLSDARHKLVRHEREHNALIERISMITGINFKTTAIHPDTGELVFH